MSDENVIIKCYLCDTKAEQYDSPGTSRSKLVECPECVNRYEIMKEALLHYFDREDGTEVLTPEQKYSYSVLVHSQCFTINAELVAENTDKGEEA